MPPGTRLEDKPIEELSPVSNIPYPHFQEWPWHYRWVRLLPFTCRLGCCCFLAGCHIVLPTT